MIINVMKAFSSFDKRKLCRQIQHKLRSIILILKRKIVGENMKKNKESKQTKDCNRKPYHCFATPTPKGNTIFVIIT